MRALTVRLGTAGLAVLHLWWGAWAYLAPRHFFVTFPGLGHAWTAAYPPFNEHLVADLGSTFLTLGVLLAIAAARPRPAVTSLALLAVLVFSSLHLVFHLAHHGLLTGADLGASLAALVGGVIAPAVLLVLDRPRRTPDGAA